MVTLEYGKGLDKSELSNLNTKFILWQVKIWDWFAKSIPVLLIASSTVLYLIGYRNWNLVYNIIAVMFVCVAVTWWFWVIYTIASIAIVIDDSGKSLREVLNEIKEIKKSINDKKNNNNR